MLISGARFRFSPPWRILLLRSPISAPRYISTAANVTSTILPSSCKISRALSSRPCPSKQSQRTSARNPGESPDDGGVGEIVRLVANEGCGLLDAELSRLGLTLSRSLVSGVLRALNESNVSALRFFDRVLARSPPGFDPGAKAYNQLVENVGRLGDYSALSRLLIDLSAKGHCLTEKAFAFLASSGSSGSVKDSVRRILETLNRVGGSCRASGVFSLIRSLCSMGAFDAAVLVMEETAKTTSYYNVLVAAKCRNGDFRGARELFDEMRRSGCDPNISSWNYLLGCLLKNGRVAEGCGSIETMERSGCLPDSLTYEILAFHACKAKRMDLAMQLLDQMFSEGLMPRMTMHTPFIKGYFFSGRMEDAYEYVVGMSVKHVYSANRNYSMLASLFHGSGRVVEAGKVLYEMMEKGLKPNHSVYVRVAKDLHKMSRGDLASELKFMFQKFNLQTEAK